MSRSILLLNGPNLNLLGVREPERYGAVTYQALITHLSDFAPQLGLALRCEQSNHEGVLIDLLHEARSWAEGVVINPGGYGHTSVALRDAALAFDRPMIEVHITNLAQREPFRHHSYLSDVSVGILSGFGVYGYDLALMAMARHLSQERVSP
jgi:3-dehydroquinate dehydratase-2